MKNKSNALRKAIYKLSVAKGYPHIKLSFEQYQQVLKQAHKNIFTKQIK